MEKTLFAEYIDKLFPVKQLQKLVELVNEKRKNQLTYLHKTMLRKEYSPDQKWESASVKTTYVAADMVALDSPLPVKKRDSVSKANGMLPKIGIEKHLNETDLNQINIMKAQGQKWQMIAKKLSDNIVACAVGIDEKNEANFLCALSRGYLLAEDKDNVGTGLRVNFNYPEANSFGVEAKGHISREDIERVLDKANADGNTIITIAIALSTYNKMRREKWAKELWASYRGESFTESTKLGTPNATNFDEAFASEFGGIKFLKIDRSIVSEKNGKRTTYKPWDENRLVFLTSEEVGALVWSVTAESTLEIGGVKHTTIDDYKLISEYAEVKPSLREITAGQALVLPVIEDVDQIYVLDVTDSDDDSQSSGDEYFDLKGSKYLKSEVISKLASVCGVTVSAGISDADLLVVVNGLSKANESKLIAALTPVEES